MKEPRDARSKFVIDRLAAAAAAIEIGLKCYSARVCLAGSMLANSSMMRASYSFPVDLDRAPIVLSQLCENDPCSSTIPFARMLVIRSRCC